MDSSFWKGDKFASRDNLPQMWLPGRRTLGSTLSKQEIMDD